jgi:hypothetical protein
MTDTALTQIAGSTFPRLQGNGVFHPFLGGGSAFL